jgi:glutamate-ammonia-ligase adenylyltransferase
MSAPGPAEIVADRLADRLDLPGLRARLQEAGFPDARAAAEALDQILAAPAPALPAADMLAGALAAADPQRALINSARLAAVPARPDCPVPAARLAAFLGGSQHMADLLVSRPALVSVLGRAFDAPTARARHLAAGAAESRERELRLAFHEDLLAITWQDLAESLDVEQVTLQLSRLAEAVVAGAAAGLGAERHFAIIGLGKLGGLELNYSSDIDLIFVRPDRATDQASADRVARALVKLLARQTPDGHLYRVDMRLRPEGSSGLLTRGLASCLQYYRDVGRPWERQMLTKARVLFDADGAGAAFRRATREWVLECGLDAGAIRQFKRLKSVTEAHYATPGDRADIKQAPGGIRDIETIVQFLSLLHARQQPDLVTASTLRSLERLRVAGALTSLEGSRLRSAYRFHRRVENLLQVMHRVQTHVLPADRRPLARLMRRRDVASFDAELAEHRRRVRETFERHFARAFEDVEGPAARLAEHVLDDRVDQDAVQQSLAGLGFLQPEASLAALRRAAAPVSRFLPVSPRLLSSFASLLPALVERLALAPDPDGALGRFESMTRGVGAREVLYAQLGAEPRLLTMLCDLAGGSAYLTELLANEPHLVDDFIDALLTGVRGRNQRRRLLEALDRPGAADPWLTLSDHKKLETLRIGLRDLQDSVPIRQTLTELSQLCIDVLRHAFEVVLAQAAREHGEPTSIRGVSARVSANMSVVALGKLGGLETNYASDADLIFVYSGDGQTPDGTPNSVFFARVAEEFIARVGGARGGPRLYKVDTRLRPEGAKGPLVTSLRALEAYYRSPRAALFERQALLRARIVAGDAELGQKVLSLVRTTVRGLDPAEDLAGSLRAMRARIEANASGRDLKRGSGGMVDIEFLTQFLQLKHGARLPALLVSETPRALEMLAELSVLPAHTAHALRDTYLKLRRVETRLQLALGLDTKEVPTDGHALRVLALRLGYVDTAEGDAAHALLADLDRAALETRERYDNLLV